MKTNPLQNIISTYPQLGAWFLCEQYKNDAKIGIIYNDKVSM